MPLYRQQRQTLMLRSLDRSVLCDLSCPQTRAEFGYALMVIRVYRHFFARLTEKYPAYIGYFMIYILLSARIMPIQVRHFSERAAESYVDELKTAADGEDRTTVREKFRRQSEFTYISLIVDPAAIR